MKGICPICRKPRWLGGKGRVCKPCTYPIASCIKCQSLRKIYVRGLCYTCFEDEKGRENLLEIENNFTSAWQYSQHLFSLYLTYTKRFKVHYFHLKQAKALACVLNANEIAPILSWMQIYELEIKYPVVNRQGKKSVKGRAFFKIGYMLQEMNILGPRHDELGRQLQNLITSFDIQTKMYVEIFVHALRGSNHAESTIVDYLSKLKAITQWLHEYYPAASLLEINEIIFRDYLNSLIEKKVKSHYLWATHFQLAYFYRFAKQKNWILANPVGALSPSRPQAKLCVVVESDYKKLFAFIKAPESHSESALLLALILFFGLTNAELAHAQIYFDESLNITLRRPRRTRGKKLYHRKQILILPTTPDWFVHLQRRFYDQWKKLRSQIKSPSPFAPLLLPRNRQHNRPLSDTIVLRKITAATRAATGTNISARVLRQTCGHLHSRNQDASMLSRLGWSPQFAFHYTWLPRSFFKSTST
jgi:site-specific recombinase XerD